MGLNKTGTGAGTTDTLPMEGDQAEAPMAGDVQCTTGFTLVAGVCVPQGNEGMAGEAAGETADTEQDITCQAGFVMVAGVCVQEDTDSGMAGDGVAEEDPPDSDSSMPICPVNYFYDDTYEWSDETGDRIGACVPDPTFLVCNQGFHYQPSGEKGTDSLLAGGTCVEDYSPPVQADEVSPEDLIEESVIVEEVQAALEAAGPVFTPVVGCCTTEIGNAIVTGLLENYRSELETIY